jgi:circadian clock protein KaiC
MNEESKPDSVRNTDVASSLNKLLQNRPLDQDEFEETEPTVNTPSLDTTVNSATGIQAFDEILDGGFPKGAVVLLAGSSGSGKSIFSFQWLFEGIKKQENGVYISLTEPLFKIVENLEKMEYYNREAIEQEQLKIIDIRDQFRTSDYKSEAIIDFIEKIVKETNAKRLCIDSITAIAYHYNDKSKIRTFIFELGTILATLGCTTILTSEVAKNLQNFLLIYILYENIK